MVAMIIFQTEFSGQGRPAGEFPDMTPNNVRGFTLIELMIVVAIIGILASLAVSTYQTFIVRGQVAEAINFAANAKVPLIDAFNNTGRPPATRVEAGLTANPADTSGAFVSAVDIQNGRLDITFGNDAHQAIFGETLSITPYRSAATGGAFIWRCGAGDVPAGAVPMSGGGVTAAYQPGTIPERYLPSTCRP